LLAAVRDENLVAEALIAYLGIDMEAVENIEASFPSNVEG